MGPGFEQGTFPSTAAFDSAVASYPGGLPLGHSNPLVVDSSGSQTLTGLGHCSG